MTAGAEYWLGLLKMDWASSGTSATERWAEKELVLRLSDLTKDLW